MQKQASFPISFRADRLIEIERRVFLFPSLLSCLFFLEKRFSKMSQRKKKESTHHMATVSARKTFLESFQTINSQYSKSQYEKSPTLLIGLEETREKVMKSATLFCAALIE
jgi:hypothetical protein